MNCDGNTPEIRFRGFDGEWDVKQLGEVAEIVGGGTPNTFNPAFWDGDIDWYAPAEMEGQIYANGSVRKITKLGLQNSSAKILPAHRTILFTSRAGIGKMAILQREGATNQGFQSLVLNSDIEPYFIYSMNGFIKQKAEGVASGSTFLEISGKLLSKLTFSFPSLKEQQQIGAFFERLDALIALYRRRREQLSNVKKSLLEKMFPREGAKVPEIRFEGFAGEWETRKLGDFSYKVTEKNVQNLYNETFTNSAEFGVISQRDYFDHDISNAEKLNGYYVVREQDFVYNPRISVTAPCGPVNCNELNRVGVMSPLYTVFRTNNIAVVYLKWFFKTNHWHRFMILNGDNGARSDRFSIKDERFFIMPIPLPQIEEQKQIGAFFQELDGLLALSDRRLRKLENVKKSFLSKLFVSSSASIEG